MSELLPQSQIQILHAPDAAATVAVGLELGNRLQAGDLVLLRGELGAGKTTFTQGIAAGIGIETPVTSPTFVLIIEHRGTLPLLHLDAYRLENLAFEELNEAGVFDFLSRSDAVKIVEWPERIETALPLPRFDIRIEHRDDEDGRILTIRLVN